MALPGACHYQKDYCVSLPLYVLIHIGNPQFVENPAPQVVLNGTDVIFTCAVISSPVESVITWKLGNKILDGRGERFAIVSDVVSVYGGRRTTSILTIMNVTGFNSDVVECFSEYNNLITGPQ